MASLNKVTLIGNLGRDPETRTFPSGDQVCNVSIATTEKWKDKQTGDMREHTEWHNLQFNGRLAEIAGQYLYKGSQIYVEGQIRTRKHQDKDGVERTAYEIRVDQLVMLGSPQGGGDRGGNDRGRSDDRGGRGDDRGRNDDRGGRGGNDRGGYDDRGGRDDRNGRGDDRGNGNPAGGGRNSYQDSRGRDDGYGRGDDRGGGGRGDDRRAPAPAPRAPAAAPAARAPAPAPRAADGFSDMDDDIPF